MGRQFSFLLFLYLWIEGLGRGADILKVMVVSSTLFLCSGRIIFSPARQSKKSYIWVQGYMKSLACSKRLFPVDIETKKQKIDIKQKHRNRILHSRINSKIKGNRFSFVHQQLCILGASHQRLQQLALMQTDRQLLTKLQQAIKLQQQINEIKGIKVNPLAVDDSSDEEGSNQDGHEESVSLDSRIRVMREEYEHRKEYTEKWYRQKMDKIYKKYKKNQEI